MKILALETSDAVASVALYLDGRVIEYLADATIKHEQSVLPCTEALLADCGLKPADMDAFAVDVGPGSFTGVRIGVTHANALGFALHKPVVGVNALETLSFPHRDSTKTILALIDARNGNGYGAAYLEGKQLLAPCACVMQEFLDGFSQPYVVVGNGQDGDGKLPSAANVARLAAERIHVGKPAASPLYLRDSGAERRAKC